MNRIIFTLALFILNCTLVFSQNRYKAFSNQNFLPKIDSIKIGYSKSQVKAILGEPYKISAVQYKDQGVIEQLSYRTEVRHSKWSTITYSFMYYNSKLIAIIESEIPDEKQSAIHTVNNTMGHFVKDILPVILPDKTESRTTPSNKETSGK